MDTSASLAMGLLPNIILCKARQDKSLKAYRACVGSR